MKKNHKKYLLKNTGSLNGRTAVITGATGTIGKEIADNLLTLGCKIIVGALTTEKGEHFKAMHTAEEQERIEILPLDLSDNSSINKFAETLSKRDINFLINNAGVISIKPGLCYSVNFLGTLSLTTKLTPILNKHPDSRVIFQTSLSYHVAHIDWKDVKALKVKKRLTAYSRSKLLLNLGVIALKRNYLKEFPNVRYVLAHPGAVASDIMGRLGKFSRAVSRLFLHSAWTGSLGATTACTKEVPENKLLGPWAFGIWGKPVLKRLGKKLFKETELQNIQTVINEQLEI